MNPPAIKMSDVTCGAVRDPNAVVARQVNWQVAADDFWCIFGPGGSGKTDFLLLAAGLHSQSQGTIRWFGNEMPDDEAAQLSLRMRIGFVFDGGHLFNHMTLAENIALPLRYHCKLTAGQLNERVENLLEFAELKPWARSTPGALGRNWLKRAGLIRALAMQPELLLLDNPLGGADARHAAWWREAVGQLANGLWSPPGNLTRTIVVTSDQALQWRDQARQFARLHDGKFEQVGKEVLADNSTKG